MIALALLAAFLVGSIPFGYLVPRWAGGIDIRTVGSKNPGFTNVYRAVGPGRGTIVLLLDVGKGVLAALLGRWLASGEAGVFTGLAGIAGHVWSPFLRFRGGKGVATTAGVFLTILPVEAVIALVVFLLVAGSTRFVSLGSVTAAAVLPIAVFALDRLRGGEPRRLQLFLAVAVALLILWRHRTNMTRLIEGTESRFRFRREKDA
jgi:glycerol-3-phosphate acyltransferase PlsY